VVGIGGLGHLALQFIRVIGTNYIVGISQQENKRKDVLYLNGYNYITTGELNHRGIKYIKSFNIIISIIINNKLINTYLY